ncbi:hypothetical protein [Antrihabitans spumae]|uniref:Uncharacterized protein n=1 Tax=Antrihabitans spumae TaxID=3373370 RepID=A0ABW7KCZ7_9NOCA
MTRTAGPRWTRKRLVDMLGHCYGFTPRGAVDTAAVAEHLAVSQRTVQRWMRGTNRQKAAIPAHRLHELLRAPAETELRSRQQAEYAREAIIQLALPRGRGVLPAWRKQGWLEPHVVTVIEIVGHPWRQVVVSNGKARSIAETKRRGTLVDVARVPTRFHAVVLAHEVMESVTPWRVHPLPRILAQGRTQVWSRDAPAVDLSVIAVAKGLS